jgi:hypothetical protein
MKEPPSGKLLQPQLQRALVPQVWLVLAGHCPPGQHGWPLPPQSTQVPLARLQA